MGYTSKEIKIIKGEKRPAYGFSLIFLMAGGLLNLLYFITDNSIQLYWILLLNLGIIFIISYIPYTMNKRYNKDLKHQTKTIIAERVEKK